VSCLAIQSDSLRRRLDCVVARAPRNDAEGPRNRRTRLMRGPLDVIASSCEAIQGNEKRLDCLCATQATVVDLHHLLLAGLPAYCPRNSHCYPLLWVVAAQLLDECLHIAPQLLLAAVARRGARDHGNPSVHVNQFSVDGTAFAHA
jgi:hypothetical protein